MALMSERERAFAGAVSRLACANPFLPERVAAEREALGPEFVDAGPLWHARAGPEPEYPNIQRINARAEALAEQLRGRLARGVKPRAEEAELHEELILYLLYNRYEGELFQLIASGRATGRLGVYPKFLQDLDRYLGSPKAAFPVREEPAHLLAVFFQVRRAFVAIFENIWGGSLPAARLRAAVWQSIFTRDLKRYRRALAGRMADITTLITGPSGTGKELVARAIALARYIPFDAGRHAFQADFASSFFPLHLSALPPTLVESELFGHKRGAFTGAVQDRAGWLEVCPPLGTVFLDEIAEVDPLVQVKLLRVLQMRTFQRLGESRERRFQGKLLAATNRHLAAEIAAGRFREDLYYRLCSDLIETPSLAEQLQDSPGQLGDLLLLIARRVAGDGEAPALAAEVERWIGSHLGRDYPWPGNFRELEQCVRNILVRGEYRPARTRAPGSARDGLAEAFLQGALTAEELLRRYATLVYARTGSYLETARRLRLDRRTVRDRIDPELLEQLREESGAGGTPESGSR